MSPRPARPELAMSTRPALFASDSSAPALLQSFARHALTLSTPCSEGLAVWTQRLAAAALAWADDALTAAHDSSAAVSPQKILAGAWAAIFSVGERLNCDALAVHAYRTPAVNGGVNSRIRHITRADLRMPIAGGPLESVPGALTSDAAAGSAALMLADEEFTHRQFHGRRALGLGAFVRLTRQVAGPGGPRALVLQLDAVMLAERFPEPELTAALNTLGPFITRGYAAAVGHTEVRRFLLLSGLQGLRREIIPFSSSPT
ncbi:hypothetical protein BH11PLA1_BH11PLA1_03640 [soil metagenome]